MIFESTRGWVLKEVEDIHLAASDVRPSFLEYTAQINEMKATLGVQLAEEKTFAGAVTKKKLSLEP